MSIIVENPELSTTRAKPLAVRPAEAARLLSVHRRTLARMAERGDLRVVRVGGTVLVPLDELDRLLSNRTEA